MGGDYFPQEPVRGAIQALDTVDSDVQIVLVGDEELIRKEIGEQGADASRFEIVHTSEFIGMEENPTRAITGKPTSSINIGLQAVKGGSIDAFISAGNTGAMLVGSILGLGNIEGVIRPAIGTLFPNENNKISLLIDVGANVDCKPEVLHQFGVLGSVYMREVFKIDDPKVALLNVGEEKSKGPQSIQAAYEKLAENASLNFAGNVESREIYKGDHDVYVCDGFVGNLLLKFGESFYDIMKSRIPDDPYVEVFNFENYGGVPILGVNGISIIGHGISTGKAFENMIHRAIESVKSGLTEQIKVALAAQPASNAGS